MPKKKFFGGGKGKGRRRTLSILAAWYATLAYEPLGIVTLASPGVVTAGICSNVNTLHMRIDVQHILPFVVVTLNMLAAKCKNVRVLAAECNNVHVLAARCTRMRALGSIGWLEWFLRQG
eukprot:950906-Amorphochlora_amoeboformis.AAC.1